MPKRCAITAAPICPPATSQARSTSSAQPRARPPTGRSGGPPARASMVEPREVELRLLTFLRREVFSPQMTVTEETDLIAAGFDSLSLVRLLLFVEQNYGVWVPAAQITAETLRNVRSLATIVCGLIHEQ